MSTNSGPPASAPPRTAARPLRVLWLTTTADTDGAGRALLALLNNWPDADAVAVCALRDVTAAFRRECRAPVAFHALGMRRVWNAGAVAALVHLCRRLQPDLISTQLSRADWIGRTVGGALGIPVVSTIQNVHTRMYRAEFGAGRARLGLALDRLTARLATRIVAVSEGVRRDLESQGVPSDRIHVIHNSVDTRAGGADPPRDAVRGAWHAAPDDVVVGTVALMKAQKGLTYLVEAADRVIRQDRRVRFVHVGDGPLAEHIDDCVRATGLAGRFLRLGRVPDPAALLPGFDVFALPSLWEGLPVALLEAMRAGLPAVGSRVAGIEEAIDHERTGLLVPPADAAALAHAILDLAADAGRRAAYRERALERIGRFRAAEAARAYRQLYIRMLDPSQSTSSRSLDAGRARKVSSL